MSNDQVQSKNYREKIEEEKEEGKRMTSDTGNGKVVCLIASWLVKLLLHLGYTVKATVRDPNLVRDPEGAKERLKLFKADLLEGGSFDLAVEGCEGVFHAASPCILNPKDPQLELIDPTTNGTLNLLKSCAKLPSLKRVVLTSSMAAMLCNGQPTTPEVVVDEAWFSKPEFCREFKQWYALSKTLAEDAARKFVKENNIDMVVIHPGFVLGSLLQPSLNESSALILGLLTGAHTSPNLAVGWTNVKDVANAHIQAFEISSANGRYCLAGLWLTSETL
ncbi:tetraketide alpha-pyrone reductase 1-like [Neltuma alba]|uniref:tetraketide alpha-pyrone reductase 1-like n=1 Tax=Neltuma alba TaxID=207710 RepID=UPI0010A3D675|nr:tetraketide alpha-pyrone reductase 1-like [Prosopis alba]